MAVLIAGGAIAAGVAIDGIANYFSGQSDADRQAQNAQQVEGIIGQARTTNNQSLMAGQTALTGGYANATGAINAGAMSGASSLNYGYGQAGNVLQSGYSNAINNLRGLDGNPNLGAGFQASPGYQFQLQQGEAALAAQNSAAGGRDSGAAQKALLQYSQGLANQDYQSYVQNQLAGRQQQIGVATNMANLNAQQGNALSSMYQNQGANLANLYGQQGNALAGLYSQQGQQSAALGAQYAQLNSQMTGQETSAIMGQQSAPSIGGSVLGGFGQGLTAAGSMGLGYAGGGGARHG